MYPFETLWEIGKSCGDVYVPVLVIQKPAHSVFSFFFPFFSPIHSGKARIGNALTEMLSDYKIQVHIMSKDKHLFNLNLYSRMKR
jgi:hypothetical protein